MACSENAIQYILKEDGPVIELIANAPDTQILQDVDNPIEQPFVFARVNEGIKLKIQDTVEENYFGIKGMTVTLYNASNCADEIKKITNPKDDDTFASYSIIPKDKPGVAHHFEGFYVSVEDSVGNSSNECIRIDDVYFEEDSIKVKPHYEEAGEDKPVFIARNDAIFFSDTEFITEFSSPFSPDGIGFIVKHSANNGSYVLGLNNAFSILDQASFDNAKDSGLLTNGLHWRAEIFSDAACTNNIGDNEQAVPKTPNDNVFFGKHFGFATYHGEKFDNVLGSDQDSFFEINPSLDRDQAFFVKITNPFGDEVCIANYIYQNIESAINQQFAGEYILKGDNNCKIELNSVASNGVKIPINNTISQQFVTNCKGDIEFSLQNHQPMFLQDVIAYEVDLNDPNYDPNCEAINRLGAAVGAKLGARGSATYYKTDNTGGIDHARLESFFNLLGFSHEGYNNDKISLDLKVPVNSGDGVAYVICPKSYAKGEAASVEPGIQLEFILD